MLEAELAEDPTQREWGAGGRAGPGAAERRGQHLQSVRRRLREDSPGDMQVKVTITRAGGRREEGA